MRIGINTFDFVGDNPYALFNYGIGHGVGYPDAFMFVPPVGGKAGEEMVTGNDQHSTLFQSAIKFIRTDREPGQP